MIMDLHVKPILINIFALCRLCLTTVSYRLKLEAVLVYSVRRTIFFLDYFFILPNLWDWHFGLHMHCVGPFVLPAVLINVFFNLLHYYLFEHLQSSEIHSCFC